jgi:hypothetical protein
MSILNHNELLILMSTDKYKNRDSYMVELLFKELRESTLHFRRVFMPNKRCDVLKNIYRIVSFNLPLLAFNSERKMLYTMYKTSFQHLDQMDNLIKKGSKYVTNTDFIIMKESILYYRQNYEMCRMIEWGVDRWVKHIPVDLLNIISSYLF